MKVKKKRIDKGWGYETIWTNSDSYCGKLLVFERAGSQFSMHFHMDKDETWLVTHGRFQLTWCDTATATYHEVVLEYGDSWHNPPGMPHQLKALEDNSIIFEVSTPDSAKDNYRIRPGDSQSKQ